MALYPNQVYYGDQKVMDISDSTVTPETLGEGATAYDATGAKIPGKMPTTAVLYSAQTLTLAQQAQARQNIGIASTEEIVRQVLESIGTPVFGIVDENNNIILNGELGDGTYAVKYEMEDGSTVNIGNLVVDTNVYYSVTNNLTQCTNSNSATEVVEGESYSATITAKDGYELKSVTVTMGGQPVSVSGGTISIASVTGNIVITAVAEEQAVAPAYKNWLPLSVDADGNDYKGDNGEDGYKTGYRLSTSSGNESALSGACVTGFIPFNKVNDVFRIKNMTLHDTSFNANGLVIYDANKSRVYGATSQSAGNFAGSITADGNGVYKFFPGNWTSVTTGNGFIRFSCGGISDDTIVTINEEIV